MRACVCVHHDDSLIVHNRPSILCITDCIAYGSEVDVYIIRDSPTVKVELADIRVESPNTANTVTVCPPGGSDFSWIRSGEVPGRDTYIGRVIFIMAHILFTKV